MTTENPDEGLVALAELNRSEFVDLLLCMGYALAAAHAQGDYPMAQKFMHLANKINENNPEFIPYEWDSETNMPQRMRAT